MALKILFLTHKFYPDIGGIETISSLLACSFAKKGYDVHLLTWSADPTGKKFPFTVIRKPALQKLFQEHAWADMVFENNLCIRLSWPGLFYKRPTIIGLHTWISQVDGKVGWQDLFKYKWLKRATGVIACSDAVRRRCWPKALVIGNPYQEEIFRVLTDIPRTLDFVFLGRLVSDKGGALAIEAFHRLVCQEDGQKKESNRRILTIIGDGPERGNLQGLVAKLGIKDNVVFTGALGGEELVNCLNQHKFLLVPSIWEEPFGIVALEGMACGCVPIVSNGGGLPDAVGNAGLVFKRGDVDSLVAAIQKINNEPNLEQQLRNAAPAHLKKHKQSIVFEQYLDLLRKAVLSF
ncbi:glycosyltransferase family 4 protein [Segetibacter koreensis]|uniref:glycosyltransferase family 4 protein n=1 Tax=Segetibacter koreensis TaxID=398037 RepID=UPI00035EDB04|nr:glycosyltransferase family 4 protein [Segetibacter koreensis]